MRIKLVIVMILAVFSVGIVLSVIVINNKNIAEIDIVGINDIVKTVDKIGDKLVVKRFKTVI